MLHDARTPLRARTMPILPLGRIGSTAIALVETPIYDFTCNESGLEDQMDNLNFVSLNALPEKL
jgi:hypothetical protein